VPAWNLEDEEGLSSGRRATGDGRRATGDGRRATGDAAYNTVIPSAARDLHFAVRRSSLQHSLVPFPSSRLSLSVRLLRLADRLDRKLGRVLSNAPLDPAALRPLNLLYAPPHLVEIVRAIAHCLIPSAAFRRSPRGGRRSPIARRTSILMERSRS